jgi:hypothetical protein
MNLMQRIQRLVAIALPIGIVAALVAHSLRYGVSKNVLGTEAVLFAVSLLLARYLLARSRDKTAQFVTVVISPDDDEPTRTLTDISALIAAGVLFVCAVLIPL